MVQFVSKYVNTNLIAVTLTILMHVFFLVLLLMNFQMNEKKMFIVPDYVVSHLVFENPEKKHISSKPQKIRKMNIQNKTLPEKNEINLNKKEKIIKENKNDSIKAEKNKETKTVIKEKKDIKYNKKIEDEELVFVYKYTGIINFIIVNNWDRPPSAYNNMVTILDVELSSFGDVIAVKLVSSSGNNAFDQSAITAIKKSSPIIEIKTLQKSIFNRYFKHFTLKFNPVDLVR